MKKEKFPLSAVTHFFWSFASFVEVCVLHNNCHVWDRQNSSYWRLADQSRDFNIRACWWTLGSAPSDLTWAPGEWQEQSGRPV